MPELRELRIANQVLVRDNEALRREVNELQQSASAVPRHPIWGPPAIDQRVAEEASSQLKEVEMALKGLCEYRSKMQARYYSAQLRVL